MKGYRIFVGVTLLLVSSIITWKFTIGDYSFSRILPVESYEVKMNFSFEGFGDNVKVEAFIPTSNEHQQIDKEHHVSGSMDLEIIQDEQGRKALWKNTYLKNKENLNYTFTYFGKAQKFELDSSLTISEDFPPGVKNKKRKWVGVNIYF